MRKKLKLNNKKLNEPTFNIDKNIQDVYFDDDIDNIEQFISIYSTLKNLNKVIYKEQDITDIIRILNQENSIPYTAKSINFLLDNPEIKKYLEDATLNMFLYETYLVNDIENFRKVVDLFGVNNFVNLSIVNYEMLNSNLFNNIIKLYDIEQLKYTDNSSLFMNLQNLDTLSVLFNYKDIINNFNKLNSAVKDNPDFIKYLFSQMQDNDYIMNLNDAAILFNPIYDDLISLHSVIQILEENKFDDNTNYQILYHLRTFDYDKIYLSKLLKNMNIDLTNEQQLYFYIPANPRIIDLIDDFKLKEQICETICLDFDKVEATDTKLNLISDYYFISIIGFKDFDKITIDIQRSDKPVFSLINSAHQEIIKEINNVGITVNENTDFIKNVIQEIKLIEPSVQDLDNVVDIKDAIINKQLSINER